MHKIFFILLAGSTASVPLNVHGQSLTWRACVEEAVRANPELLAAKDTVQSARAREKAARSPFLPQLSGGLSTSYGDTTTGPNAAGDPTDSYGMSLSLSQNLFSGLRDRASLAQARAQTRINEVTDVITQARVSYDLKFAYSGLLYAQRAIKLQDEIISRRKTNLGLVELRFKGGRENRGSLLLSQANLRQAQFEGLLARNSLNVARTDLARVLARSEDSEIAVTEDVPLEPLPTETPDFMAIASEAPTFRESVEQEQLSFSAITLARSAFFPTLSLTGSLGRSGPDWYPNQETWSVGANLSLPLFDGGRDYYSSQSAAALSRAASFRRENVNRQVLTSLKTAYASYGEAIEKLEVDESFRLAAIKRAEIARGKYNNGLMSFEDWDVIENELIVRERAVLESQRNRTRAEATWLQVRGKSVPQ